MFTPRDTAGSSSARASVSSERVRAGLAAHSTVRGSLIFASKLPEEAETLEVKLPRGPAAFCTPRINGRPPKGAMVIRKSYAFTVEPKSTFVKRDRIKMQKQERMKIKKARRSPTEASLHDDMSLAETDAMSSDKDELSPAVQTARRKREHYYDRARFRQERAQKFGAEKRFPVLVSPKLMPEWQDAEYAGSSDEDGGVGSSDKESTATGHASLPMSERRRVRHRLQQPTLILAVRQESSKRLFKPSSRKWNTHGDATEVRRMCARSPVLFQEEYKPPSSVTYRDTHVDNWVASDNFKLPSIAGAKRDIEFNAEKIEQEISDARAKGHRNRDQLEVRLENKLEAYKREQEERGPLSNFALRELEFERRGKDTTHHHPVDDNSTESVVESFAERMSIGFSRYRMSRLHLPSD